MNMGKRGNEETTKPTWRFGRFDALTLFLLFVVACACVLFWAMSSRKSVLTLCAASVVGLAYIWLSARKNGSSDAYEAMTMRVFTVLLTTSAILYGAFFAPGTVPDEMYHYQHAYYTANAITPGWDIQEMRAADYTLRLDMRRDMTRERWADQVKHWEWYCSAPERVVTTGLENPDFSTNLPQMKLPSALGIVLGRLLGLGALPVYYLGRLFNTLYAVLLICLAVRLTPIGRNPMMALALLPMTLHLLGSYSYDASIVGLSFLLTAVLLKLIFEDGIATRRELVAAAVVSCLLGPCKVIYATISLLVFLVPARRFSSRKVEWLFKLGVLLLPFAAIGAFRMAKVLKFTGISQAQGAAAETMDVRAGVEGHFYDVADFVENPSKFIFIILNTIYVRGSFYIQSLVGTSLGWFQESIMVPDFVGIALVILLLIASVGGRDDALVPTGRQRIFFLVISLMGIAGAILSMLFIYTFDTENYVVGCQGRYFLPMMPLFLLSLRGGRISLEGRVRIPLLAAMFTIAILELVNIAAIMPA